MQTLAVFITLAAQLWAASPADNFHGNIVVLTSPGKDQKIFDATLREINNSSDLSKAFPTAEFIHREVDPSWTFVFDRNLTAVKQALGREALLKAFLKNADSRGIVRLGDLTEQERSSALSFLVGPGSSIEEMGDASKEVHVALRPALCMYGSNGEQSIEHRVSAQSSEMNNEIMADLTAHGVPFQPRTRKSQSELEAAMLKMARDEYGLSVRYYGVRPSLWVEGSKRALEELTRFLQEQDEALGAIYTKLHEKLAADVTKEFGGTLPPASIPPNQAPNRYLRSFVNSIRSFPNRFGLQDQVASERFLTKLSSVSFDLAYEIMFVRVGGRDSDGKVVPPSGFAVELGRG